MKRARVPAEAKSLDYARQSRYAAPRVHNSRKDWPKLKQVIRQIERRRLDRELARSISGGNFDPSAFVPPRRDRFRTNDGALHEAMPLRDWVVIGINRRRLMTARSFFKDAYDAQRHRQPFTTYLTTLMAIRRDLTVDLAKVFRRLMDGDRPICGHTVCGGKYGPRHYYMRAGPEHRPWLDQFFLDEPALRTRFEQWLATSPPTLVRRPKGILGVRI